MKNPELTARGDAMAEHIHKINEIDPGTRAALRRGLGRRPEDIANFHAHAVVTRYLPDGEDEATERAFYTVAALIAAQPRAARDQGTEPQEQDGDAAGEAGSAAVREDDTEDTGAAPPSAESGEGADRSEPKWRNLGQALAWAVENGALKEDTAPDRLHLLARYRLDRLHRELPKLVAHLRADLVPIDWGHLLRDLARWGHERDRVAKEWVQHYHRTRHRLHEQRKKAATNTPDGTDPGNERT